MFGVAKAAPQRLRISLNWVETKPVESGAVETGWIRCGPDRRVQSVSPYVRHDIEGGY